MSHRCNTGAVTLTLALNHFPGLDPNDSDDYSDYYSEDFSKTGELDINGHSLSFGFNMGTFNGGNAHSTVYLVNRSSQKSLNFHLKVSILKKGYKKVFTKEYDGDFDDYNEVAQFSFMRPSLITSQKGYLHKNRLTLLCEVELFEQRNTNVLTLVQQKDMLNLSEDFQTLQQDVKFHDATLVVGKDGNELHVHKNVLAARSPVFAAMFEHDFEEKRLNKVTISDIDQKVCEEMLRYIYTGMVQSLDLYAMDLLVAADKYQLSSLKNHCIHYLSLNLTIENATSVLMLADLHNAAELKEKCMEYISDNAEQVEVTEGWEKLNSRKRHLPGELFMHAAKKMKR